MSAISLTYKSIALIMTNARSHTCHCSIQARLFVPPNRAERPQVRRSQDRKRKIAVRKTVHSSEDPHIQKSTSSKLYVRKSQRRFTSAEVFSSEDLQGRKLRKVYRYPYSLYVRRSDSLKVTSPKILN